jgi:hypothetical protein
MRMLCLLAAAELAMAWPSAAADVGSLPTAVLASPVTSLDDTPEMRTRILRLFRKAVLVDEGKHDRGVVKWTGPILVSMQGADVQRLAFVRELIEELSRITGLSITLGARSNGRGDIEVELEPGVGGRLWPSPSFAARRTDPLVCAAAPHIVAGRIEHATVRINAPILPAATVEACLLEEIVQSLGLLGETTDERETILNDEVGYRRLGIIDRLLLAVLYDHRLPPGMASGAAMPLAAEILDEVMRTHRCEPDRPSRAC